MKANIVNSSCDYNWSSANQYYEDIIKSKSSLRINDSVVKSYFSSKKEFEIFLNTPNGELDDFKEEKDLSIKISNSLLAEKLKSILKGRSISDLTREELKNHIILFACETKASYIQLSNLFQVSYTYIRDTIHHR